MGYFSKIDMCEYLPLLVITVKKRRVFARTAVPPILQMQRGSQKTGICKISMNRFLAKKERSARIFGADGAFIRMNMYTDLRFTDSDG